jgi:hypothetical protein
MSQEVTYFIQDWCDLIKIEARNTFPYLLDKTKNCLKEMTHFR